MNNKTLLIILCVLLALFGLSKIGGKDKKNKSFNSDIFSIDTSAIQTIKIKTKFDQEPFEVKKSNGVWNVSNSKLNVPCSEDKVKALFDQIVNIKALRVAATKAEKWKDYEIDEALGSSLQFFDGSKQIADLAIGRFKYNPQQQSMTSFVRLPDEGPEVYAVDGYLPLTLQSGFNGFRKSTLVNIDKDQIRSIGMEGLNGQNQLLLVEGNWTSGGAVKDSTDVADWIKSVHNLEGAEFHEDPSSIASTPPIYKLNILGEEQVEIKIYKNTGGDKPFVIHSNQNAPSYFLSDSTGVYKKLAEDLKVLF